MRTAAETPSLVDRVYRNILDYLYDRSLTSPELLSDVTLAETFQVSRTPVRTALARLESEGLVRKVPSRGWSTIPLAPKDIAEIFDLKEMLEAHAASTAAEVITQSQASDLLHVTTEMEEAAAAGDMAHEMATDLRYHALIYQIAGNSRLIQMQARLDSQWYRLRKGQIALQGGMKQSSLEHRLITDAIVAHEPALAGERSRQHLRRVRNGLLHILNDILMPFLSPEFSGQRRVAQEKE